MILSSRPTPTVPLGTGLCELLGIKDASNLSKASVALPFYCLQHKVVYSDFVGIALGKGQGTYEALANRKVFTVTRPPPANKEEWKRFENVERAGRLDAMFKTVTELCIRVNKEMQAEKDLRIRAKRDIEVVSKVRSIIDSVKEEEWRSMLLEWFEWKTGVNPQTDRKRAYSNNATSPTNIPVEYFKEPLVKDLGRGRGYGSSPYIFQSAFSGNWGPAAYPGARTRRGVIGAATINEIIGDKGILKGLILSYDTFGPEHTIGYHTRRN